MAGNSKPTIHANAFLFVEPHAGYDADEAASSRNVAAPSLSRFELIWERLLRRKYLLGVVSSDYGLASATAAHGTRKSLSRFLHPGTNKNTTGDDNSFVRAQSGFNGLLADFNGFLDSSLEWFILGGDAGLDRYWTSGVAVSTVHESHLNMYSTGSPGYADDRTDVADEPQFTMPAVAFKTLGEAWPRTAPKTTALPVSEGIGHDGNPLVSVRTYVVPRWKTSLPEGDLDRVSTVDVDGIRTYWTARVGYGVNDLLDLPYLPYARREHLGSGHAYLADIPARAPTREFLAGGAPVWPVPSVTVSRYADEGWEADDLDLMPARLRPSVAACFVPPAVVPCLRAEFPPADGWRCGMANEHGGVPYGDASNVLSSLRILYRATAGSMDAWLARMSRTATEFSKILWEFEATVERRRDWYRDHTYDPGGSPRSYTHEDTWSKVDAESYGSYAASPGDRCELNPSSIGTIGGAISGAGWGVSLYAPSPSGHAEYATPSNHVHSHRDEMTGTSWTSVDTYDERASVSWNASLRIWDGVPVWSAPWSYTWRYSSASKSYPDPQGDSGVASESGTLSRVIPPEFMPFVERAEVFAFVRAATSSKTTDKNGVKRSETHTNSATGRDDHETYESWSEDETRAEERRLVSLGVLDESGTLPSASLPDFIAVAPAAGLAGASAPYDGGVYGSVRETRRTDEVQTGWSDSTLDDTDQHDYSSERKGRVDVGSAKSSYILVVDWKFDVEHDPFADSEMNALWRELADAGQARAAAATAAAKAEAAYNEASAALAAAQAAEAELRAKKASLDDGTESARRLAELGDEVDAARAAAADAETARTAAEAALDDAKAALRAAEAAPDPDEEEIAALREEIWEALGALAAAEDAEDTARIALKAAEDRLADYQALVDDAAGARAALDAEIDAAAAKTAEASAEKDAALAAKNAADAAYAAACAAYDAILARIRQAST